MHNNACIVCVMAVVGSRPSDIDIDIDRGGNRDRDRDDSTQSHVLPSPPSSSLTGVSHVAAEEDDNDNHSHSHSHSPSPSHPAGTAAVTKSAASGMVLDWAVVQTLNWDIIFLLGGGFALSKGFQVL